MTNNNIQLKHVLWAAGAGAGTGLLLGKWYANYQAEERKKSRAEKENPEDVDTICRVVAELLDELVYESEDGCDENAYRDMIADYLNKHTDFQIEVGPDTDEGEPDILIEDLLALEIKVNPDKSERDRCVGQCAGYSRDFVTWILLMDTPSSRAGRLQRLLQDKGLERMPGPGMGTYLNN